MSELDINTNANPFNSLAQFNAYKDKISEYIAQELVKYPQYLSTTQKQVHGLQVSRLLPGFPRHMKWVGPDVVLSQSEEYIPVNPGMQSIYGDGVASTYLDGTGWVGSLSELIHGQVYTFLSDIELSLDETGFSNFISHYQHAGGQFQKTLREGQVFTGRRVDEIFVVYDNEFSSQANDEYIIDFIAYACNGDEPSNRISVGVIETDGPGGNTNELGNERWNWLPVPVPYIQIQGYADKIILAPEGLKQMFDGTDWQSGDLGVKFNDMSSEEASTSFNNFLASKGFRPINVGIKDYDLSDNTSQFLAVGVGRRRVNRKILKDTTETEITELLPGTDEQKIKKLFDVWNNTKHLVDLGIDTTKNINLLSNGDMGGGIGPGQIVPGNSENSVDVIAKHPNPGYSQYVYKTSGEGSSHYLITLDNKVAPGKTITLSAWYSKDTSYSGTSPAKFFHITSEYVYTDGTTQQISPGNEASLGWDRQVSQWNSNPGEVLWTRYSKTITLPTEYQNKEIGQIKLFWRVGKSDQYGLTPNNDSETYKYFTGFRIEVGDTTQGAQYIDLAGQQDQKSIAKIAYDCQKLFQPINSPDLPQISTNTLDTLLDASKIESTLEPLYLEIKDTLFQQVTDISTAAATAVEGITNAFTSASAAITNEGGGTLNIAQQWVNYASLLKDAVNNHSASLEDFRNNEFRNVKEWVTGFGAQYRDLNGDGFDDDSYNKGYDDGYAAGYSYGTQQWLGELDTSLFDINGNGSVSYSDANAAAAGPPYFDNSATAEMVATMIEKYLSGNIDVHPYDVDNNGVVNTYDIWQALNNYVPDNILANMFEVIIAFADEVQYSEAYGPIIPESIVMLMDLDGDGEVTLADAALALQQFGEDSPFRQLILQYIAWPPAGNEIGWDGFHPLDFNKNHNIDLADIQYAIQENSNIPSEFVDFLGLCLSWSAPYEEEEYEGDGEGMMPPDRMWFKVDHKNEINNLINNYNNQVT